ncbi:hypothetical protein ACRRTK_024269 [Alexandromys fortis]
MKSSVVPTQQLPPALHSYEKGNIFRKPKLSGMGVIVTWEGILIPSKGPKPLY